jgi:hypothetical protein
MLAGVPRASADTIPSETFLLTSDHCTGGCLTGQTNGGNVVVNQNADGTLTFIVTLANGNEFVNTGFQASFGFNLTGVASITYTSVIPASFTAPGGNPQATGSLHMDGTGDFDFGLEAAPGGGSNPTPGPLTFTIKNTGGAALTLAELSTNGAQQFFGVDIISGTTTNTGGIDASSPVSTPDGGSTVVLLGLSLLGLGAVSVRSRSSAGF